MQSIQAKVQRVGWFYCAPDWSWECQGSSVWPGIDSPTSWNYDLWTILEGEGTLYAPHQVYTLQAGDCFILRGTDHYIAQHNPQNPLVVAAIHFDYLVKKKKINYQEPPPLYRRIEDLAFFTHLLERLDATWHAPERNLDHVNTWLQACLVEVERQDRTQEWHGFKRRQAASIEAIGRRIRTQPEKPYTIDELAQELHCSRRHFTRLFSELLGKPPQDYIVHARIEAAKGLLHASSYSIARIAELTGYRDIYFFSRQFKQKTGVSPSAYRKH